MSTTFNSPTRTGRTRGEGLGLIDRHFRLQAERPRELGEIEIDAVDSLLRLLLFCDGSITGALAAHSLAPVAVDLVDQAPAAPPALTSRCLALGSGDRPIRRRVVTTLGHTPGEPAGSGFAESFLVAERLAPDFLPILLSSPAGIGEALLRAELEVRRELLWFGLGAAPSWATPTGRCLVRAYRIVTGGRPAILISEGFSVRSEGGRHTLRHAVPAPPHPAQA
jgi:chorismate-pyruvate lyase